MIAAWFLALGAGQAFADDRGPLLTVDGPQGAPQLSGFIEYYLDEEWDKTIGDMMGDLSGDFQEVETPEPDFGYTDSRVWLRIRAKNVTSDIDDWRVYVRENFLQYYDVFVLRENGKIEHLESHDLKTKFHERSVDFPELVTSFKFAPGEEITLFVSYWSGGSSHAGLTLESTESFAIIAVNRMSKNYISYGMMVILVFASLFGLIILRLPVFLAYMSYVFVTLLYLMHQDGVTFQHVWPGWPSFNSYFSIIIGTLFVMATYNFARVFLQTSIYHPRADRFMWVMFWLTPVLTIIGAVIDPQITKQYIFALVFLAILSGTVTGLLAAQTRFKYVRFYLFAWVLGGIGAAGLMNLRHIFGVEIAQDTEFDSVRVSIVIDALMMGLGIADHYIQVIRARQAATAQNLVDAEQNLFLNNRLYTLEEQYKLASELSISKDQVVRTTIHDLRQPLHALRMNIQALRRDGPTQNNPIGRIEQNFEYLEQLIRAQLEDSISDDPSAKNATNQTPDTDLSLNAILTSIHEMFLPDAREKGLKFTFVPTSITTDVNPLVIMRIISNLVSNAIKYTPAGKILMGVRRQNNGLRIEVHDTGAGLSTEQFKIAQAAEVRLHRNQYGVGGDGLGLAIANQLASAHDLELFIHPDRKNGTSVILRLK